MVIKQGYTDVWHGQNFVLACVLFIASSVFTDLFQYLVTQAYGLPSDWVLGACKFDCEWYTSIMNKGYYLEPINHHIHVKGDSANWAFFPAFPLIADAVATITNTSSELALIITSKLFLLLSIFTFITLAEEELGAENKIYAGLILAFNPYIIHAHSGYTETLYFFLTTLGFLLLRRKSWILAGIAGGLLSATRPAGFIFTLVYITHAWRLAKEKIPDVWPGYILGLMLSGLGLACYMSYLHFHMGDALSFMHVQIAWWRHLGDPLNVLMEHVQLAWEPNFSSLLAIASLAMSIWFAIRQRFDYALFIAGSTLLPWSTGLMSMPRYIFWQMPVLLGLVQLLAKDKLLSALYLIFSAGMSGFVIVTWFKNNPFAI